MKKYNLKNQVHFITINTYKKYWLFKKENLCQIVIDNLNFYRRKFSFKLLGYVIMPNHLHLLIQLNKKYNDISKVMRDFKKFTSVQIIKQLIKENEKDLLKKFSMTGKIFNYPSTLGTARSSDRAGFPAEGRI
ncbi:MAG: transposase [Patescibacteria group bacterium]|nr:transposase [Patescibacteria group bacterium]